MRTVNVELLYNLFISLDQSNFINSFQAVFLPAGYPDSVSDDYTTYQIWDTIQVRTSITI